MKSRTALKTLGILIGVAGLVRLLVQLYLAGRGHPAWHDGEQWVWSVFLPLGTGLVLQAANRRGARPLLLGSAGALLLLITAFAR